MMLLQIYTVKADDGPKQEEEFAMDENDGDTKKLPMESNKPAKKTVSATKSKKNVDSNKPFKETVTAGQSKKTVNSAQNSKRRRITDDGTNSQDDNLDDEYDGHRRGPKKSDTQLKSKDEPKPTRVSARLRSGRV